MLDVTYLSALYSNIGTQWLTYENITFKISDYILKIVK